MNKEPESIPPKYNVLKDIFVYFFRLGSIGFGGPIALVTYMEKDLVESKKWITGDEYLRGLTLSELAPGPLAAQFAIYVGYIRGGILGATIAGISFILPSFLMVVVIGALYIRYGHITIIRSLFYGIGAAVIGIIAVSAYRLVRITLKGRALLWIIFLVMGTVTAFTKQEFVSLLLLSGVVALFIYAAPKQSSSMKLFGAALLSTALLSNMLKYRILVRLFLFFTQASLSVFGSGLAIVPFLHGGVVQQNHWLTEREFLDAVAIGIITPGPVVITVGFIGYVVAGLPGAIVSALGVFLPVYLFVVIPTPYFERYANNPQLKAFVQGVTAAAIGAIAGAVIVLGEQSVIDIYTTLIAIGTIIILLRFKIPEPLIIVAAGILGLLLSPLR